LSFTGIKSDSEIEEIEKEMTGKYNAVIEQILSYYSETKDNSPKFKESMFKDINNNDFGIFCKAISTFKLDGADRDNKPLEGIKGALRHI